MEIETNKLYHKPIEHIQEGNEKNYRRPLKLTEIPINSTNLTEYEKERLSEMKKK